MLRNVVTLCVTMGIAIAIGCGGITTPQATPTPTHTFEQAKRIAKRASYEELYRNNETYQGKQVFLKGEVVQVIADGNSDRYELRVAITAKKIPTYGRVISAGNPTPVRYENPVYVHYKGPVRLLENDLVEIVGNVKGLITYETISGSSVTVPEITDARLQRCLITGLPPVRGGCTDY